MSERNEQVEKELEKLVGILTEIVPQLTEIRVFGSYNNGNWNEKTSDIDIFVETEDEDYSLHGNHDPLGRIILRAKIVKGMNKTINRKYKGRLGIHLLSVEDMEKLKGLAPQGNYMRCNMKSGRLIYQNKQTPTAN